MICSSIYSKVSVFTISEHTPKKPDLFSGLGKLFRDLLSIGNRNIQGLVATAVETVRSKIHHGNHHYFDCQQ